MSAAFENSILSRCRFRRFYIESFDEWQHKHSSSHVAVGRVLYESLSREELQENLFLVVNQMILGIPLLTNPVDKTGVASLALEAGKKASRAGDFATARMYFQTGVNLLGKRHWRDEYHLSLDLYNCLAEKEASCGEFEKLDLTIDEILSNCRSPRDEIRPHVTRMMSLSSRVRFKEALQEGFHILSSNLGGHFPSKPWTGFLIRDMMSLQRRLRRKSNDYLLSLPKLDDTSKMAAIEVLGQMSLSAFCGFPEWFPFIVVKTLKLTLKFGLGDASGYAFASYGLLLAHTGDYDQAYRYGMLGLRMVNQSETAKLQWFPRVSFIVHAGISPVKKQSRRVSSMLRSELLLVWTTVTNVQSSRLIPIM